MDEGEIKQRFIESAFLIDPVYLFESRHEAHELASLVISRFETLAGKEAGDLYSWLARIMEGSCSYCFYGSSLQVDQPGDADMMLLTVTPGMLFFRKPSFVSVLDMQRVNGELACDWGCFFFGALLFPQKPPEFVLNTVDYCRESAFARPFFEGGYGEPLTYAAFKAIGNQALFEPEDWEAVKHLKRFEIKYRRLDLANMLTVGYSPREVNVQIRNHLRELDEKEMRALARAAVRKIGVKMEHQAPVAQNFIAELRKMK